MKTIEVITKQLSFGRFDYTRHAFKRAVKRDISEQEIKEAGKFSEIIEEYPDDKYSPSCLLLGFTELGRPLHMQVSRADTDLIRIITLHEPDKQKWIDYRKRR